jgi:amidohydrolase
MISELLLAAAVAGGGPSVPDAEIAAIIEAVTPGVVATRRDIHAYPELGNREYRTGKLVAARLRGLGLEVRYPVAKTGVVAILRGDKPGHCVAVRADMDALPIEESREVAYKSRHPGIMHACGHDVHAAVALGAAETLSRVKDRLRGAVVFLFQPAEEGPPEAEEGGAVLMVREGVLDAPRVEAIFGLHVDPTLDVGRIGWSAGVVFASADRFVIDVAGQRAHGAYPHTGIDPVPIAAEIVLALQALVARQADAQRPKVLTIGSIHGGERANILAENVRLEGALESLDESARKDLKERMTRVVSGVAGAYGAKGELRFAGEGLPVVMNDASLVRRLLPGLALALGRGHVVEVGPQMGSEDFGLYAQRVPAFYFRLGVRNEARGITAMVHTAQFDVDESALPVAVRALCSLVLSALE